MLKLFAPKSKDLIGIDIGSTSIKLVVLKETEKGYILDKIGLCALPAEAIVDGTIMDSSSVVDGIKWLVKNVNLKVKKMKGAASSVAGKSLVMKEITVAKMSPEELKEHIPWEAESHIPFDPFEVNIDFQVLREDPQDPSQLKAMIVACKLDMIDDYVKIFKSAGLNLEVLDTDAFAIQNAFEANYKVNNQDVIALVNIGANVTNINIVKNGESLFAYDIQMGGNLYNDELQRKIGLSGEEVEKKKIDGYPENPDILDEVIDKVNNTLAAEIGATLDIYNVTVLDEERVNSVCLSGGASITKNIITVLTSYLSLPVDIFNPFLQIKYDTKEFNIDYIKDISPFMAVAVGLALRKQGDK